MGMSGKKLDCTNNDKEATRLDLEKSLKAARERLAQKLASGNERGASKEQDIIANIESTLRRMQSR